MTRVTTGLRILIASPLGHVVADPLKATFEGSLVTVARDRDEFRNAIAARVRFDVVSADLIFNHAELEWTFDGLDVIEGLRTSDRLAPVLLATQGHSMEEDHLAEARRRADVSGVVAKSAGLHTFVESLRTVAYGQRITSRPESGSRPSLFEMFNGRRGTTAARMAGAIAAGNAADVATLAEVARVSANTASKVASNYVGPMMRARNEHDERLPLTQASVFRWCGLHARYIVSWCRRHGHADVLAPR
ncbi:response regulator transcription factor [Gordonia sp. BP-94]|nr:response regulator transcription factor [Gordonia sp. BP-119]MBN0983334.1 response regulator transcription factor [Gordonia sp. BP-94]MBR7194290.1 response regulator transcription factor [Gordonia sp. SCSIO 19800]